MALVSTEPRTAMSIRNISWGVKTAGAYYFHVSTVLKSQDLNLPEPSGPVWACNGIALPFTVPNYFHNNCNGVNKMIH